MSLLSWVLGKLGMGKPAVESVEPERPSRTISPAPRPYPVDTGYKSYRSATPERQRTVTTSPSFSPSPAPSAYDVNAGLQTTNLLMAATALNHAAAAQTQSYCDSPAPAPSPAPSYDYSSASSPPPSDPGCF